MRTVKKTLSGTLTPVVAGPALVVILGLIGAGAAVGLADDTGLGNTEYDGRFTFVRLSYDVDLRRVLGGIIPTTGPGMLFGDRDLPWAHDYPRAEQHLAKILEEVTLLNPVQGPYGGNVFPVGDPEMHKYPFAYMSEPGFWTQTDEEAASLRRYLLKGGFIIFDDFRDEHWYNFEPQLRRVLPGARLVQLDISHPIFHSFFDIKTLDLGVHYNTAPTFWGVFEDNDPSRRLMVIANYDNDIGEYWEFSDTGWYPIDLTNEAYKLGVNYVIYAMTH